MEVASLSFFLEALEVQHGGVRKAAAFYGIDPGYWWRLRDGEADNPSIETLEKLGLRKVVTLYEKAD